MGLLDSLFGSKKKETFEFPSPGPTEKLGTDLLGKLYQLMFDALGREPTDEELQASIEPIFALAARRGGEDIQTRAIELAGRSGLNLSDSPVANVALRQQRELTEGLQAKRAETVLGLRQQAVTNRLALGELFTSGAATLGGIRTRTPLSVTTRERGPLLTPQNLAAAGTALGAIPPIISGVGSLLALSDREAKQDIRALSRREEAGATEAIRETPIYSYRFRGLGLADEANHVGPMAGEGVPAVRTAGGKAIDLGDAQGRLMASMKDIDARLRRLEGNR